MNALRPYIMSGDDVVTISSVLLFVLFTFVLYRSRMVLLYKTKTFFSSRHAYAAGEITTSKAEMVDIMLLILIGCISASAIIRHDAAPTADDNPQYGTLLWVFLVVVALVVGKGLLYSLVNWTFFPSDHGRIWLSAFFFSVAIVSAVVFPLAMFYIYADETIINIRHCLVWIIILQKILLLCKLFVNFRPKRYGSLLYFLYFCSVEIMPTLVVWHLLSETD